MKLAFQIIGFPLRLVIGLAGATIVALALMISPWPAILGMKWPRACTTL